MPVPALKSLAKKAKISLKRAEHLWNSAKEVMQKQYDVSEDDPSYWAIRMGITKKMMGLKEAPSFKEFINQHSSFVLEGEKPSYKNVSFEEAVKFINDECKNSLWMIDNRKLRLWRGTKSEIVGDSGCAIADSAETERKSAYTTNYYTMILDNNPWCAGFPKRSRSFIGTTSLTKAEAYGGNSYVMIPADSAKIGITDTRDIWDKYIEIFGKNVRIDKMNDVFDGLGIGATLESFKEFDKKLKLRDEDAINKLVKIFDHYHWANDTRNKEDIIKDYADSFLDHIWEAYSPANTGFSWYTTSNLPRNYDGEIWVSGKVLFITYSVLTTLIFNKNDLFKK